jgi:hypothetical protein|tara:strand:- start:13 stop:339 length:327 start_codon:yes stop_codon:yes gene_type:complete
MNDIVKDKINLNNLGKPLTEIVYTKFSNQVRSALLDLYYGGFDIPMRLLGTTSQINSFMKTLSGEKRYMDSYLKNGLDDPKTMSSKYSLATSVKRFEKETGLRWPFKN